MISDQAKMIALSNRFIIIYSETNENDKRFNHSSKVYVSSLIIYKQFKSLYYERSH